jgi:hypothetical protein
MSAIVYRSPAMNGRIANSAVEPAHPRLRVHAAMVRNVRYLREAFFVER